MPGRSASATPRLSEPDPGDPSRSHSSQQSAPCRPPLPRAHLGSRRTPEPEIEVSAESFYILAPRAHAKTIFIFRDLQFAAWRDPWSTCIAFAVIAKSPPARTRSPCTCSPTPRPPPPPLLH